MILHLWRSPRQRIKLQIVQIAAVGNVTRQFPVDGKGQGACGVVRIMGIAEVARIGIGFLDRVSGPFQLPAQIDVIALAGGSGCPRVVTDPIFQIQRQLLVPGGACLDAVQVAGFRRNGCPVRVILDIRIIVPSGAPRDVEQVGRVQS